MPARTPRFYRLLPAYRRSYPSLIRGRLYRGLTDVDQIGYLFIDLDGNRRCVYAGHFERVQARGVGITVEAGA